MIIGNINLVKLLGLLAVFLAALLCIVSPAFADQGTCAAPYNTIYANSSGLCPGNGGTTAVMVYSSSCSYISTFTCTPGGSMPVGSYVGDILYIGFFVNQFHTSVWSAVQTGVSPKTCAGSVMDLPSGSVVLDSSGNLVMPASKTQGDWYWVLDSGTYNINGIVYSVASCSATPTPTLTPTANTTPIVTFTPVDTPPVMPYPTGHAPVSIGTIATLSTSGLNVVNISAIESLANNNITQPWCSSWDYLGGLINNFFQWLFGILLYPVNWIASNALTVISGMSSAMIQFESSAQFIIAIMCYIVDTIPVGFQQLITLYLSWNIARNIMEGV